MTNKELEAREAALARREANQVKLQNPHAEGSTVLDHGIQEGKRRCKDQLCEFHWQPVPIPVLVTELCKFEDLGTGRIHEYTSRALNSHMFYEEQEPLTCKCGKQGFLIPPGGKSAFDSEFEERLAESGPGSE